MAIFTSNKMLFRAVCVAGVVAIVHAAAVAADNPVLATAYGTGVHAYYAGDYQRTYDDLTTVIEGGANDPRAYYFRGLAALKLGRIDEADADFATGAAREAAALGTWNVPRSLERVQGEDRLRLERHRSRARVVLAQQRREALVRRYAEIDGEQESVLRRRRPETAPARSAGPVPEEVEAPAAEAEEEPAEEETDEPEMKEDAPAEEEGGDEESEDADDSPFGDDAPGGADGAANEEASADDAEASDDEEDAPAEDAAE